MKKILGILILAATLMSSTAFASSMSELTALNELRTLIGEMPSYEIQNERIVYLYVNSDKLTYMPESIGYLTDLRRLYFYGNNITSLPNSIGNLRKLNYLYLSGNNLTSLPESFGYLTDLWILDLDDNNLTSLPESFGNLAQLRSLEISNNNLTSLPESFGNLTDFVSLDISNNNLTSLPESFGNLTRLSSIDLSNNNLTTLPESFGNLIKLPELSLSNNNLTSLPESIGNLTNLSSIDLSNNNLISLPNSIGNLTNLSSVDLSNNNLASLPESFGNLTKLSKLFLSNNNLTSLPESIGNLTNLSSIDLSDNNLISLPDSIGNLTKLVRLNLNNNYLTWLPDSISNLRGNRWDSLSYNPNLNNNKLSLEELKKLLSDNMAQEEFKFQDVCSVSGYVKDDSGNAVSRATVTSGGKSTFTEKNGFYILDGFADGIYTITANKLGYISNSVSVTVSGADKMNQNITLQKEPEYSVSGYIRDSNGYAVSGATVACESKSTTTSSDGFYTLSGFINGTYTITASKSGYVSDSVSVTVNNADKTNQNIILATATYSVSGYVRDGFGTGVSGVTVKCGDQSTTTSNGYYILNGFTNGTYTITASKSGYESGSVTVTVSGADKTNQTIMIQKMPEYSISGYVKDNYNNAVSSAVVKCGSKSTTTSSNGSYTLRGFTNGTYTITASKSGYETQAISVVIDGSNKINQDISLLKTYSVSGYIIDDDGKAVSGATVTSKNGTIMTDSDGYYIFSGFINGTYAVTASKSGYGKQTINVIINEADLTNQNITIYTNIFSVSGYVRGLNNRTLSYATVTMGDKSVTTSGGRYILNDVVKGTHTITASAPGYASNTVSVTVEDSDITDFDIFWDGAHVTVEAPKGVGVSIDKGEFKWVPESRQLVYESVFPKTQVISHRFTLIPWAGYAIKSVTVNGKKITANLGSDGRYNFTTNIVDGTIISIEQEACELKLIGPKGVGVRVDDDSYKWIGSDNEITYSNIPPGNHALAIIPWGTPYILYDLKINGKSMGPEEVAAKRGADGRYYLYVRVTGKKTVEIVQSKLKPVLLTVTGGNGVGVSVDNGKPFDWIPASGMLEYSGLTPGTHALAVIPWAAPYFLYDLKIDGESVGAEEIAAAKSADGRYYFDIDMLYDTTVEVVCKKPYNVTFYGKDGIYGKLDDMKALRITGEEAIYENVMPGNHRLCVIPWDGYYLRCVIVNGIPVVDFDYDGNGRYYFDWDVTTDTEIRVYQSTHPWTPGDFSLTFTGDNGIYVKVDGVSLRIEDGEALFSNDHPLYKALGVGVGNHHIEIIPWSRYKVDTISVNGEDMHPDVNGNFEFDLYIDKDTTIDVVQCEDIDYNAAGAQGILKWDTSKLNKGANVVEYQIMRDNETVPFAVLDTSTSVDMGMYDIAGEYGPSTRTKSVTYKTVAGNKASSYSTASGTVRVEPYGKQHTYYIRALLSTTTTTTKPSDDDDSSTVVTTTEYYFSDASGQAKITAIEPIDTGDLFSPQNGGEVMYTTTNTNVFRWPARAGADVYQVQFFLNGASVPFKTVDNIYLSSSTDMMFNTAQLVDVMNTLKNYAEQSLVVKVNCRNTADTSAAFCEGGLNFFTLADGAPPAPPM